MHTEIAHQTRELARKNEQRILRAMADSKQLELAALLGTSESTVSRMKDGDISKLSLLLAGLGLKIVPQSVKVFDPNMVEALALLAKDSLARVKLEDWIIEE